MKDLLLTLKEATQSVVSEPRFQKLGIQKVPNDMKELSELLTKNSLSAFVLAEAALIARKEESCSKTTKRDSLNFIVNKSANSPQLLYTQNSTVSWSLDAETIRQAVVSANKVTARLQAFATLYGFDLFELLGLRNLSALMGEIFAQQVLLAYNGKFIKNANQDGYPDLCALTPEGSKYVKQIVDTNGRVKTDKSLWSPFPYGGVEVKATCGNTPAARVKAKPLIGESRIEAGLVKAEWKAHHQDTKSLLGVFWDFVDTLPTFLAAFYRNDLTTDDWGKPVVPKGDSHTTSVSIMKPSGVVRMGQGWLVLPTDQTLLKPIARVFSVKEYANNGRQTHVDRLL
jgi:hypothetical protein